jgi:hypothetical protein
MRRILAKNNPGEWGIVSAPPETRTLTQVSAALVRSMTTQPNRPEERPNLAQGYLAERGMHQPPLARKRAQVHQEDRAGDCPSWDELCKRTRTTETISGVAQGTRFVFNSDNVPSGFSDHHEKHSNPIVVQRSEVRFDAADY